MDRSDQTHPLPDDCILEEPDDNELTSFNELLKTARALLLEARSSLDRASCFLVRENMDMTKASRLVCAHVATGAGCGYIEEALVHLRDLHDDLGSRVQAQKERSK